MTTPPKWIQEQFPPLKPEPEQELADWWFSKAQAEVEGTVAKAIEYGSVDLLDLGRDLARCMDREVTDAQAAELGVYFYLRGKFARWSAAVLEGRQISDDTLFDIGVYVRMAQRIRETGGWPNG